jgi:phage I-like protein
MTRRKTTSRAAEARLDALPLGAEFPPKAVKLFAMGENRTTKGVFLFDDAAAKSVLAAFAEHGVDLAMDFDHGALAPADGRKRDVPGYYRPEVRADGLYAIPQWTDVGLDAIRPGASGALPEYRYTSPSFSFDPETRRVLRLGPLALTSYPATHHAKPLTLTARDRRGSLATLGAMSFEDITEALMRAGSALLGYGCEVEEVYADRVVFEVRGTDGRDRCMSAPYTITDGVAVLGDLVEVEETYVPVNGGLRVAAPTPAPMSGASQPAPTAQETPMTASAVLGALGATDEGAALATLTTLRNERDGLVTALGAKSYAEAVGVLEAHRRDAAELAQLRATVEADRKAAAAKERTALLDAIVAEGKLTPAERAQDGQPSCWLTALDAAALSSYRAARAPVVQTTDTAARPAATPAAVTDEVAALAAQLGVDAATLATNLASARAAAV